MTDAARHDAVISPRRIIRNFLAMFVFPSTARGIMLVMQLVVAWALSMGNYVLFAVALSFCAIAYAAMDFGLCPVMIRDIAADKSQTLRKLGKGLACKLIIALAGVSLSALVAIVLYGVSRQTLAICLLLIAYAIFSTLDFLRTPFRAHDRMHWDTGLMALDRTLAVVFALLAMYIWRSAIAGCVGFVVGTSLSAPATLWALRSEFGLPKVQKPGKSLQEYWPLLWPVGLFVLLVMTSNRIHVLLVREFSSDTQTALYAAAFNLLIIFQMTSYALREALYPTMSQMVKISKERNSELLGKAIKAITLLSLPIILCLFVRPDLLIRIVYPDTYLAAASAFKILILSFLFTPATNLLVAFLRSNEEDRSILFVTIGQLVIILTMGFWLIPQQGATGAAWIVLATEAWNLLFCSFVVAIKFGITPAAKPVIRFALSGTVGAVTAVGLSSVNPVMWILATYMATLVTFVVLGGLSLQELSGLWSQPELEQRIG